MTAPQPGAVLRRALLAWGLGHLALGATRAGRILLAAEVIGVAVVAWLTIGLADSSAYLIPFLAGVAFIVAWAWQAIDAYRRARALAPAIGPTPQRSPAAAAGWLSLPLLVWGTGFWLIGAHSATPAAVLDRFVTQWTSGSLAQGGWPAAVERAADRAADDLGSGRDPFRDVRVRLLDVSDTSATAVAEAVHFERREARFLWVFTGSELVPVADEQVLTLELEAEPVELPGGGDIGAVRWTLASASPGAPPAD